MIVILTFYCFGIILNLFEEIEFFKYANVKFFKTFLLTCIFVPSLVIKLSPFIIFISSIWFMVKIRNNKDLFNFKSLWLFKLKIFFILALRLFY